MHTVSFQLPRDGQCYQDLEVFLIARFGGFTRTPTLGGWQGPNGPCSEANWRWDVGVPAQGIDAVLTLAKARGTIADQHSLWIAVNGVSEVIAL